MEWREIFGEFIGTFKFELKKVNKRKTLFLRFKFIFMCRVYLKQFNSDKTMRMQTTVSLFRE